jgi:DNA mismatch repair protein MutS2
MAALPHSSARVLEFTTLRELLRAYTWSDLGRARVEALEPSADRTWFERQQQLTAEVREFLRAGGNFEFHGLHDHTQLLHRARIAGAALESEDIRNLLVVIERAQSWREIALHPPEMQSDWAAVRELSLGIVDFSELLRYFKNKFRPDGTLDDHASPTLNRLRREMEKQKRAIQESLRSWLRRLAEGGAIQDELITIRGERFVIPVKVEQKRKVQGVIHGASNTGQTVFVEPMETIELNNDLVRLIEEETEEIHRILLEMTAKLGEQAAEIARATEILGELELQFGKARFANDYQCVQPTFTDAALSLTKARHPLLERNLRGKGGAVVPLSLTMENDARQLIISGPNTGGKTVGLKTVGLLALMAQAGVPVPADHAELPVFDAVLADIGDYQSIEQNLSTFSAHVTNIDFISQTATAHSLVLLDELGSATDPEEGAALAVAIAEHFSALGCISIISTHHTSLKVYAANRAGVLNAAVGFEEKTLQPTYELRVGVPGASAGINIAQQLGLNPQIIAAARMKVSSQTQDIATFLDKLNREVAELERERASLRTREQEVAREKGRLAAEGMKEQRAKVRELEKKIEEVVNDFQYRMRETISAVQDKAAAQKMSKEAERRVARMRREFQDQFNSTVVAHTTGSDQGDPNARPTLVKNVGEGDTVKLRSLGRNGVVRRRLEQNIFEVEVGIMKMKVPRSDIAEVVISASGAEADDRRLSPVQAARSRGISVSLDERDVDSTPSEINVIGQNVDQATTEVEKFLDRAFLAGMQRVRIVHGSGMGVLRKALREMLRTHPHVEKVSEPPQNEGGAGATVVELRS